MRLIDLFSFCLRSLTRRKVRTLLTVTGVVIGTCCIIVMIALAEGIRESNRVMLSEMGDLTLITLYEAWGTDTVMDDEAMRTIGAMEHVVIAAPFLYFPDQSPTMYAGKNQRYQTQMYNIVGIYPETPIALDYAFSEGGTFSGQSDRKVQMLFGQNMAYQFQDARKRPPNNQVYPYPDENGNVTHPFFDPLTAEDLVLQFEPSKDTAKALKYDVEVVGILEGDYMKGYETMEGAYLKIEDMRKMIEEYRRENKVKTDSRFSYSQAVVKVSEIQYVGETEQAIREMGFETSSMEATRESIEQSSRMIQLILGSVGGISLFVAAIGIANTMIMSIHERTREIGVMKVLGCMVRDIRTLFLMESGMIGLLGGVLGVGLSWLLVYIFNNLGSLPEKLFSLNLPENSTLAIMPPWLVAFGLIFATLVGLISGFYPANRAVRISALEAIRQE